MKYLYLMLHLVTVSFPLIRSFEPKIRYSHKWNSLFIGIAITGAFFIVWDIIFTNQGVWGFNPKYLIGIYVAGLPLEEILFFITVPFASVFIYECVLYFFPRIRSSSGVRLVTGLLGLALIAVAITHVDKSYTFWSFAFTGAFLILLYFLSPEWLSHFWVAYLFHLIPFVIVNGVLTGSGISEPIVWYNNAENLAIRLHTIPIEDTVYALLLLAMNVTLYEKFKHATKQNAST